MKRGDILERDLKNALRTAAVTPCPGEESLLTFYRGDLDEAGSEAIRGHLAGCASCVELARDARRFLESMEAAPRRSHSIGVWGLAAAAALLVAAAAGLWMTRQRPATPAPVTAAVESPVGASNPWRDLPVAAAVYRPAAPEDELVFRSDEPSGDGFPKAIIPYTRGDYSAADAGLARFLREHPGHAEASFYRGVSLLMLGRPEEARPLLASSAASVPAPEEARWYLALALLKSGDAAAALEELDAIVAAAGLHRAEAEKLAGEVRGVLERK